MKENNSSEGSGNDPQKEKREKRQRWTALIRKTMIKVKRLINMLK